MRGECLGWEMSWLGGGLVEWMRWLGGGLVGWME